METTCETCGALLQDHPDWVLPDRTVKYCNGVVPICNQVQPATFHQGQYGSCGEYL